MSLKTSNLPFKARVDHEVHNTIMRKAVVKAQETIGANRQKMVDELGHWEEWRDLSKQIRNHVLTNLDAYLYQLSEKVIENGGKVYFAETAEEASAYIRKVALEKNAKKIVKSKSMVTEEIGLNEVLEKENIYYKFQGINHPISLCLQSTKIVTKSARICLRNSAMKARKRLKI